MSETRNVVVLGASYAGIGAAHYFLKHVYPSLKTDANTRYKVILVNPSTKMFQRIASPRAAASTTLIPEEKLFLDIEPGFKQYGEAFQFIQGSATFWDPQTRTVELARVDGKEQILAYHALILATGSKTYSPFLSNQGTQHGEIQSALKMLHHQLETATSIVIAGGGPAGVEVAGEIGEYLNGAAGWFSSRPSKPRAHISLYTSSNNLLPALRPTLGKQAEKYLNRVGVDVLYGRKLASTSQAKGGRTRILLENGKEFDADIFIPAMGAVPMSDFVPERLRTEKGLIKMNARTMRVDEAGPRVYALGDVGSAFRGGIMGKIEKSTLDLLRY